MRWDYAGNKALGLMTRLAVRIHLRSVGDTNAQRMTRRARAGERAFSDRGSQSEGIPRVRIGDRAGSKGNLVCERRNRGKGRNEDSRPNKDGNWPRAQQIPRRNPVVAGLP